MNNTEIEMNKKAQSGFTLVEMAVVIIIAGFIFVPLMAVFVQKDRKAKESDIVAHEDKIVNAINFFLKQHGRLPCPAGLDRAPTDADFGVEDCTTGTPGFIFGGVPVQTLGLPYHMAINEYDWKYFYAVTERLTDETTFDGLGDIVIQNADGDPASNISTQFVVVNPGKDGKGASSLYGVPNVLACNAGSSRDSHNCDNTDNNFRDAPISIMADVYDGAYYDDRLAYGLFSQKSDFWILRPDAAFPGKVSLYNRTSGNVGIGTDPDADARLHVSEGAIVAAGYDGDGGHLDIQANIEIGQNLTIQNSADVDELVQSNRFCFGQVNSNTSECCSVSDTEEEQDFACCEFGDYIDLRTGVRACKEAPGSSEACFSNDAGNVFDASQNLCCHRYELDKSNRCCVGTDVLSVKGVCCSHGLNEKGNCNPDPDNS